MFKVYSSHVQGVFFTYIQTYVHQKTCMRTYIATLFIRTPNGSNTNVHPQ